jgi:hypothetical protein
MPEPPPFSSPADRPAELPMSDDERVVAEAVERIGPARVRHCARNTFAHLRGAWRLHPVDSEMSLFRAITAEEEAASALIFALKQQRYPGAERLNPRNHNHKAAVWPIIEAMARGFVDKGIPKPNIAISRKGEPRIEVQIDLAALAGLDHPLWARPDHPFNVVIRSDEKGPFEVHRWERELAAIAAARGDTDIGTHISAEANLRNRILYASNDGIPAVRFEDSLLLRRLERVKWMLVTAIGILQTATFQLLAVQALEALLIALDRFEGDSFPFPEHAHPDVEHLDIEQQPDGSIMARVVSPKESGEASEA